MTVHATYPPPKRETAAPLGEGHGSGIDQALLPEIKHYNGPGIHTSRMNFEQFTWLRRQGIAIETLIRVIERSTVGQDESGQAFVTFPENEDVIFWQPKTGELATLHGLAFALGEPAIDNAATFALDGQLSIYGDPVSWLRADCAGIVVLDWSRAFWRLIDCPRIAVEERLLATYRRHMKPARLPSVSVLADRRAAA